MHHARRTSRRWVWRKPWASSTLSAGSPPSGRPSIRSGVMRRMRPCRDRLGQRARCPASNSRPLEGHEAAAALLDVHRRAALDERQPGPGRAGRLARGVGPRRGHAERVGRVGRRQHHRLGRAGRPRAGRAAAPPPPAARTARRPGPRRSSRAGTGPASSIARSSPYTAENPPGTPSASTAARVTTPWRSSSTSASARARSFAVAARLRAAARPATSARARRAAPRSARARRVRRIGAARRHGPKRRAAAQRLPGVVGDEARPHELPQVGQHRAVGAARRRPRGRRRSSLRGARARRAAGARAPRAVRVQQRHVLAQVQAHLARARADPHELAARAGQVEPVRAIARDAARAGCRDSIAATGSARPSSWATTSRRRVWPRPRSRPMPCQAGRNRPSTAGSTGSTSRRSRASVRRRSRRSTSGATYSRPLPAGRNPPSSSSPALTSRASDGRGVDSQPRADVRRP